MKLLLSLPASVSCPVCQAPLEYVYVQPKISEVDKSFRGTTIFCPYCPSTVFISLERLVQVMTPRVMQELARM